jgi:hypothetical protein
VLAASLLDQDAAHGLGRGGEKMAAAIPFSRPLPPDQAKVGLVDQGRRLERLARCLGRHAGNGQAAQLGVDEGE